MSGRVATAQMSRKVLPPGVGQVDGDAVALHLADHHPAELAEAAVVPLEAAVAEQVLLVVGELADPQAELLPEQQDRRVGADEVRVLRQQDVRQLALGLGAADGGGGVAQAEGGLVVDDLQERPARAA